MARPVLGPASDVIRFDNPLSKAVSTAHVHRMHARGFQTRKTVANPSLC